MISDDLRAAMVAAIGCVKSIRKMLNLKEGWEEFSNYFREMREHCDTPDVQKIFLNARKYRNPAFCGIHQPTAWNTVFVLASEVDIIIQKAPLNHDYELDVNKCAELLSHRELKDDELKDLLQELNTEYSWAQTAVSQPGTECLVTLQQAASMVNRSKKTLERKKTKMPQPRIPGGGGKPDEWAWTELRPWLEKEFERPLPERFPADKFRST